MSRLFDDDEVEETKAIISQCAFCKRKRSGSATCEAYPQMIPNAIMLNRVDHRQPYDGDNGLQFVPRDGIDPAIINYQLE